MLSATERLFGELKRRLESGFRDPVMREQTVRSLHAAFQAQFMSQGTYGGPPWAQLAESTIRRRPGASYMILVDTGRMREALTEPGGGEVTIGGSGDSLTLDVGDVEYASYHQTGTPNMPARELITERMLDQLGDEVADQIGDRLIGEGEGGLLEDIEGGLEDLGEGLGGLEGLL